VIEFLSEYGLFLAKAVTIVIAIIMIITVAAASAQSRHRRDHKGDILVTPLNDFFEDLKETLRHNILDKDELKALEKARKKEEKAKKKHKEEPRRKRIFCAGF